LDPQPKGFPRALRVQSLPLRGLGRKGISGRRVATEHAGGERKVNRREVSSPAAKVFVDHPHFHPHCGREPGTRFGKYQGKPFFHLPARGRGLKSQRSAGPYSLLFSGAGYALSLFSVPRNEGDGAPGGARGLRGPTGCLRGTLWQAFIGRPARAPRSSPLRTCRWRRAPPVTKGAAPPGAPPRRIVGAAPVGRCGAS